MANIDFEQYVKDNQQGYIDDIWALYSMIEMEESKGKERDRFEQGFLCALGWIGGLLGLDLLPISDEDKEKINSLFK